LDLSNGGFSSNTFKIESLPVGNKILLEVNDFQGSSTVVPCNVNVKINKNLSSLESLLENIVDMSNKLLIIEIYETNINYENRLNINLIDNSINMLDYYFENFNFDDFLNSYEEILSRLITVTNENIGSDNINRLLKILNVIMKYIDPLMNDLNKIENLFKVFDNLNKIAGNQLQGTFFFF